MDLSAHRAMENSPRASLAYPSHSSAILAHRRDEVDSTPVTPPIAARVLRAMIAVRFRSWHSRRGVRRTPMRNWFGCSTRSTNQILRHRRPLFGTLIALLHRGQPVLGAIHQPILNQLMIGDGTTTTLNGKPVRCRTTAKTIEDATLLTTDWRAPWKHQNGPAFEALAGRVKLARTWGDCYGYLLVASGWADVMCDPIMNPWDIAALIPVIRGAGGVITDWQGNSPVDAQSIVACATPELHAAVIAGLNR
jgi:hypothetical protein